MPVTEAASVGTNGKADGDPPAPDLLGDSGVYGLVSLEGLKWIAVSGLPSD